MEHTNRDPMTDRCLDCGAPREAIDDNLFPTCAKFEGPHKLALIAVHQALGYSKSATRWNERMADEMRDQARKCEDAAAAYSARARLSREDERALGASLDLLKEASSRGLTVGEAIARDGDRFRYLLDAPE